MPVLKCPGVVRLRKSGPSSPEQEELLTPQFGRSNGMWQSTVIVYKRRCFTNAAQRTAAC